MDAPGPDEMAALIAAARGIDADDPGSGDDPASDADHDRAHAAWDAVLALQRAATRGTLAVCTALLASADPRERRVGAAVLAQMGPASPPADRPFREERLRALVGLLRDEAAGARDSRVLAAALFALGHLDDPRAVPGALALRDHPEAEVRRGAVSALSGHGSDEAVAGLIDLTRDADAMVRDWATFGLGQRTGADTPALRAALRARLEDTDRDARDEAVMGLARRGDASARPALLARLAEEPSALLLEAAARLADPALCDALGATGRHLAAGFAGDTNLRRAWQEAVVACGCAPAAAPKRRLPACPEPTHRA